jgi:antitoxin (DNA-binding transcriptional repressor) of toxin-antitoxin stability system
MTLRVETRPETKLDDLITLLNSDDEILLTKDGVPIARLSAVEKTPAEANVRVPGLGKGKIWISPDFDAPLPDTFWSGGDRENPALSNIDHLVIAG